MNKIRTYTQNLKKQQNVNNKPQKSQKGFQDPGPGLKTQYNVSKNLKIVD